MSRLGLTFDHIGLHVGSLEPARAFFVDDLQLEVVAEDMETDGFLLDASDARVALHRLRMRFPETDTEVRIIENPGAPQVDARHANRGTGHLCFYTSNLDETWKLLESHGTELCSKHVIRIEGGVFDGGKCIYCVGPDGFRIEFLDGPAYLDGSIRDVTAVSSKKRANEASHFGLHVRDRDRSLEFYRDLLETEEVAGWLEETRSTRDVIGYPDASLWMSIMRLPGTQSFYEIIEYRNVPGQEVDNSLRSNGVCHIAFRTPDKARLETVLTNAGVPILANSRERMWCADPDGYRVCFLERK